MKAMRYETFVRRAFELFTNQSVDRFGDPAGMADTDHFDNHYLEEVKSTSCYSLLVFKNYIHKIPDIESEKVSSLNSLMDEYHSRVFKSKDISEVSQIIDLCFENFIIPYFNKASLTL